MKQWISFRKKDGNIVHKQVDLPYPKEVYRLLQDAKKRKEQELEVKKKEKEMVDSALAEIMTAWQSSEMSKT